MLFKLLERLNAGVTFRMVDSLLGGQSLVLVDVGSAGGAQPRWMQVAGAIRYIGFEPDARSNAELTAPDGAFAGYEIIPCAVWQTAGELQIQLCRKPEVSSHFRPNRAFVEKFPRAERFDVVDTASVTARRLDDLKLPCCDFIKLDIQGGELSALQSGEALLATTLGIEVEVEFLSVYESQPLFGEICRYLDAQGFEFMDFTNLARWDRRRRAGFGQCVFGDALFLKSPETLRRQIDQGQLGIEAVMRYLAILALYRRTDLMAVCQTLFKDVLEQQPGYCDRLQAAIGRLERRLKIVRAIGRVSATLMRCLGNQFRLRIHC